MRVGTHVVMKITVGFRRKTLRNDIAVMMGLTVLLQLFVVRLPYDLCLILKSYRRVIIEHNIMSAVPIYR